MPPNSTQTVDVTDLLGSRAARGALGLRLDATLPVTASLRSIAAGDLFHAVAGERIEARAALALPSGPSRLVLSGADGVGVATYAVMDAKGKEIARERVELTPGRRAGSSCRATVPSSTWWSSAPASSQPSRSDRRAWGCCR